MLSEFPVKRSWNIPRNMSDDSGCFRLTFLTDTVVPGSSLGLSIHMRVSSQDGAGICGASTNSGNLISEPAVSLEIASCLWVALNGGCLLMYNGLMTECDRHFGSKMRPWCIASRCRPSMGVKNDCGRDHSGENTDQLPSLLARQFLPTRWHEVSSYSARTSRTQGERRSTLRKAVW